MNKKIKKYGILKKILRGFLRFLTIIFFKIPYRIKVEGIENLAEDRAIIVCPNHKSTFDPVFLVAISKRNISFISKKEIFQHWWGKLIGYAFDMIPINRKVNDISAVKMSYDVLDRNMPLGIFPEGTRNGIKKGRGFKSGIIYMALKKNVDIVPVGISGDIKIFRKNKIKFGKPINFNRLLSENNIVFDSKNKEQVKELSELLLQLVLKEVDPSEYIEYRKPEILEKYGIN